MGVIYDVHLGLLSEAELPTRFDEVADDWMNTLKAKRAKIINNLKAVIPDEAAYISKIVDRSNTEYSNFIRSDHPRYDEIMLKRQIKMEAAKSDYITNRDAAFEEGGKFETQVTARKQFFRRNAVIIWMVTGDRDKIYGPTPKARYALEGKKAILEELITSADNLITNTELKPFFKYRRYVPSVVATINKWLTYIAYALKAGWSDADINNKIATKANDELMGYVNSAMMNPDLDPANSAIKIEKDASTGRWGIRITEATPA